MNCRIIENDAVEHLFAIVKRSGQLSIKESTVLDVNHLHTENIIFSVEVSTEIFIRYNMRIIHNNNIYIYFRLIGWECTAIMAIIELKSDFHGNRD